MSGPNERTALLGAAISGSLGAAHPGRSHVAGGRIERTGGSCSSRPRGVSPTAPRAGPKARPSSAGGPAVDWVAVPRPAKRQRGPDAAPPRAGGDDSDGEEGGLALLSPSKATGADLLRLHNRQVKADGAAMAGPRAAWLEQHLDVRGAARVLGLPRVLGLASGECRRLAAAPRINRSRCHHAAGLHFPLALPAGDAHLHHPRRRRRHPHPRRRGARARPAAAAAAGGGAAGCARDRWRLLERMPPHLAVPRICSAVRIRCPSRLSHPPLPPPQTASPPNCASTSLRGCAGWCRSGAGVPGGGWRDSRGRRRGLVDSLRRAHAWHRAQPCSLPLPPPLESDVGPRRERHPG